MSPQRRSGKKILRLALPILLVAALALTGSVVWLLYGVTRPPRQAYLVTPERFRNLSARGMQATDERWQNADGTEARGWLLRGTPGSPAVILFHAYGADRSWLFNLAVKLNEATNFTVLVPDARGHGLDPLINWTSFGAHETQDASAAINHLRTLVGDAGIGLYGVEMGAYTALVAATREGARVRSLVLDSVPAAPDDVLRAAVRERVPVGSVVFEELARGGLRLYLLGNYDNTASCAAASSINAQRVLLLSGPDAGPLRDSTQTLAACFPVAATNVETNGALPLTGIRLASATGEQGEAYDRLVINFFNQTLR
jgi:pimeloyl-ACP methyl ester carboxylesterase